jgi:NADPH:quinone reductase-like Zn-dependent oxidoreductase
MMKAARIHRYGGKEVVLVEQADLPKAGPNEVLVRVAAAGVNPVDWKIREGYMQQVLPIQFPYTLGCELAGIVESTGEGVTRFSAGDKVFGYPSLMRCGAFAEAVTILESELAHAPASIDLPMAAALPVACITAYDGLFTHGAIEAGQRVLILGGSGGVGSIAIQMAVGAGAEVYATASARNQQWLSSLGAFAIDYGSQSTADVVRDVDLILDCVGVESGIAALPSLKEGGRYVTTVYALPPAEVLAQFGAKAAMYGIQPSGDRLREIAALVDEGKIKMAIDTVFTLDQVPEALAASQAGRTRGKLLIHTSSN